MKIEIEKTEDRGWFVRCGERWTDQLAFDEMLGTIAILALNGPDAETYLRTAEHWEADRKQYGPFTPAELAAHQKQLTDQREAKDREADAIFPNVKL